MQTGFYDKNKLMQVVGDRGYTTTRAVADALKPYFEMTTRQISAKLERGSLTKEECEVIGSCFRMTMKEYYDVFMNGLFREDEEGHYVAIIDEMYLHLHQNTARRRTHSKTAEEKRAELLEEIESI